MKFLFKTIIVLGVLFGGIYLVINYFLTEASKSALPTIMELAQNKGLKFDSLTFSSAKWSPPLGLSWNGVEGSLRIQGDKAIKSDAKFSFQIETLTAEISDISYGKVMLSADDLALQTSKKSAAGHVAKDAYVTDDLKSGALLLNYASYPITIGAVTVDTIKQPKILIQKLKAPVDKLAGEVRRGVLPSDLSLDGVVQFTLRDRFHEVQIREQSRGGVRCVTLDLDGLQRVSESFNTRLSKSEVKLISEFPMRVPRLLQIKYKAEKDSDTKFPNVSGDQLRWKDAYRRVLWSYLLTGEYDARFAKSVTDAHEEDVIGQSDEAKRMDLRNDSIGREYFRRGVPEERILETMRKDKRIFIGQT